MRLVRFVLPLGDQAVILVDVRELEEGETVPRHAADQIIREEDDRAEGQ